MKISISIDDALVNRIDEYASANFMTRSGFFAMASTQLLNAAELSKSLNDISTAMKKIADTGTLDDVQLQKLDDFQSVARLVTEKK